MPQHILSPQRFPLADLCIIERKGSDSHERDPPNDAAAAAAAAADDDDDDDDDDDADADADADADDDDDDDDDDDAAAAGGGGGGGGGGDDYYYHCIIIVVIIVIITVIMFRRRGEEEAQVTKCEGHRASEVLYGVTAGFQQQQHRQRCSCSSATLCASAYIRVCCYCMLCSRPGMHSFWRN